MKYFIILILLTLQIYSKENFQVDVSILYNKDNAFSIFIDRDFNFYKNKNIKILSFEKVDKKVDTKVLWLKGEVKDIRNINYQYLIIESPNNITKFDKKKPILLILDKDKKIMINAYKIIDNYPNVQIFIGDVVTLEINNQIIPLIENFINKKIISKKYNFTQNNKKLTIENLNNNKKLEIFNKNWYISKKCNSLCKLSFLTYPKYIYSILYQVEKTNNKISKAIKNVFFLIKQKKYLKALLLTIELKSKFKTNFDFKSLLDSLKNKVLVNEKYLDVKY